MAGIDKYTKLMLHCDGDDESQVFIDSATGKIVTAVNTAQIDTIQSKFGGASLLLDGNSDYLTLEDSPDWDVVGSDSDNWTIDFFVRHADYSGDEVYLMQREDDSNYWMFDHYGGADGGIRFIVISGGNTIINTGYSGRIEDSNWHHLAMCKVGSEYGMYKNGTQTDYIDDSDTDTFAGILYIGAWVSLSRYFYGHMDELRIAHSNAFNAAPNVELSDTIIVPTKAYSRITGDFFPFLCEAYKKGKKYFKKKGLYLPDDKLYEPEILIPEGI